MKKKIHAGTLYSFSKVRVPLRKEEVIYVRNKKRKKNKKEKVTPTKNMFTIRGLKLGIVVEELL